MDTFFETAQALGSAAFTFALMGLMWWMLRAHKAGQARDKQRLEANRARARELGWEFVSFKAGEVRWRMRGTSPSRILWEIDYDADSKSSSPSPKLSWRAPLLAARPMAFTTAPPGVVSRDGTASLVYKIAAGVQRPFGSDRDRDYYALLEEARFILPRNPILAATVVILCRDPAGTKRIFDDEIERLMDSFPKGFSQARPGRNVVIARHGEALEIEVGNLTGDMPTIEHTVRLGEALADRIARMPG